MNEKSQNDVTKKLQEVWASSRDIKWPRAVVFIALVLGLVLMITGGPYRIVGGGSQPWVWRINQWTGEISFCTGGGSCESLKRK